MPDIRDGLYQLPRGPAPKEFRPVSWGWVAGLGAYAVLACVLLYGLIWWVNIPVEQGPLYYAFTVFLFIMPVVSVYFAAIAGRNPKRLWFICCVPAMFYLVLYLPQAIGSFEWAQGNPHYMAIVWRNTLEVVAAALIWSAAALIVMAAFTRLWKRKSSFYGTRLLLGGLMLLIPSYGALNLIGELWSQLIAEWIFYVGVAVFALVYGVLAGRRITRCWFAPFLVLLCLLFYYVPPGASYREPVLAVDLLLFKSGCFWGCAAVMVIAALVWRRRGQYS